MTAISPRPVRRPVMLQHWNDITWLHWAQDPDLVQALLPPSVRVDTFAGQAWVGLVPFRMTRLRPPGLPAVPWLTTFPEINVRTYVVAPDGRRAVWFWSLDAPRAPAIAVARLAFGLPYFWADAAVERHGDRLDYRAARRRPHAPAATRIAIEADEPVVAGATTDLDLFLTARFGLLAMRRGQLVHGAIEHPPWPLRRGRLVDLEDSLVAATGLPAPVDEPLVHVADGVPVRVGRLHPVT